MKIRDGFVSNSSSSSFVIHKSYLDNVIIEKIRELYNKGVESQQIYDDNSTFFLADDYYVGFSGHCGLDEIFSILEQEGIGRDKIYSIES